MTDLSRYRNDVILLYVEDRLSISAIANRYAAEGEDVRRLLKIEGVELRSGAAKEWRPAGEVRERPTSQPRQYRPATAAEDAEEASRADRLHVRAIVSALDGKGFPYFNIRGSL